MAETETIVNTAQTQRPGMRISRTCIQCSGHLHRDMYKPIWYCDYCGLPHPENAQPPLSHQMNALIDDSKPKAPQTPGPKIILGNARDAVIRAGSDGQAIPIVMGNANFTNPQANVPAQAPEPEPVRPGRELPTKVLIGNINQVPANVAAPPYRQPTEDAKPLIGNQADVVEMPGELTARVEGTPAEAPANKPVQHQHQHGKKR
jgi:ribosomal protein L37AE/L43A